MTATDIIALIALVLSVLNLIIDRRDKIARLQIYIGTGTKEKNGKKYDIDNGYVVEIINQGQTKVIVTSVTVFLLQKNKKIIETTTEKVETHLPLMRYGSKNNIGYHFESIQRVESYQSLLSGGENAMYWLPKDDVNYAIDSNLLSVFEPDKHKGMCAYCYRKAILFHCNQSS